MKVSPGRENVFVVLGWWKTERFTRRIKKVIETEVVGGRVEVRRSLN